MTLSLIAGIAFQSCTLALPQANAPAALSRAAILPPTVAPSTPPQQQVSAADPVATRYRFARIKFSRNPPPPLSTGAPGLPPPAIPSGMELHGRFAAVEAGETLELVALRHGIDPEQLRLMNVLGAGKSQLPEDSIVCLERSHRVLPGESLKAIARLYRADPKLVRRLNQLGPDDQPELWSKLLVPCPVLHRGSLYSIPGKVVLPGEDPAAETALFFPHQVVVAETDTWDSLAQQYRTSADQLRKINIDLAPLFAERGSPPTGVGVQVAHEVVFRERASLIDRVMYLEHHLRCDLDEVLALNELDEVEAIAEIRSLLAPIAVVKG